METRGDVLPGHDGERPLESSFKEWKLDRVRIDDALFQLLNLPLRNGNICALAALQGRRDS